MIYFRLGDSHIVESELLHPGYFGDDILQLLCVLEDLLIVNVMSAWPSSQHSVEVIL